MLTSEFRFENLGMNPELIEEIEEFMDDVDVRGNKRTPQNVEYPSH